MRVFGTRLKAARKKSGKTQKEMAELFGLTERGYRSWEGGGSEPSIENLVALADFLDVSLDWLCGRIDGEPAG